MLSLSVVEWAMLGCDSSSHSQENCLCCLGLVKVGVRVGLGLGLANQRQSRAQESTQSWSLSNES